MSLSEIEAASPAPKPAGPPAAETEAKPAAAQVPEIKSKKSFFSRFRFSKKAVKEAGGGAVNGEAKEVTPEQTAENIYKQLAEIKSDEYFVWRVKKNSFLVFLGIMIVLMWLVVLLKPVIEKYQPGWVFWNPNLNTQQNQNSLTAPAPAIEASPSARFKIRVRNNSSTAGAAQDLAERLGKAGYTDVEVVDDQKSEYAGVFIITKPNGTELQKQLSAVLNDAYPLSSPSAELTMDSDFDAVILFGIDIPEASAAAKATIAPSRTSSASAAATRP
jgi:hypothetical protein